MTKKEKQKEIERLKEKCDSIISELKTILKNPPNDLRLLSEHDLKCFNLYFEAIMYITQIKIIQSQPPPPSLKQGGITTH